LTAFQIDGFRTSDVFLYDRVTDTTTLVSHAAGAALTAANGTSTVPSISSNGQFVTYASSATDLVPGFIDDNGTATDFYVYDRITGANRLVSRERAANYLLDRRVTLGVLKTRGLIGGQATT
jgi:hypothetical protein